MTPDQIDAIRTFARGLPSDGTAPDTAILQLAWDYEDLQSQLAAANERADGLQRIVDEARAQKPVCITTLDDFGTVVAYPPPNVLHSVPLYAAAHVPAQPSALTERWTQAQLDQLNSKASDLFKAATHKPLAEDVPAQPAVVQDAVVRALIEAAQMAVEMIETEKHERRHVRWALKDALLAAKPADTEGRKDE